MIFLVLTFSLRTSLPVSVRFVDLELVEGAPLRILKSFKTTKEWLLEAGDMLYLPPHLAHWGIAISDQNTDCMTYSIGFRAPKEQELATEFLGFMQDRLNQDQIILEGLYQDPELTLQEHPAEISKNMIEKVSGILQKIQWIDDDVADFLGIYLSDPKADVVFQCNKKISKRVFSDKLAVDGISLDLKSQMLFSADTFYLNGESIKFTGNSAILLQILADKRNVKGSIKDDILLEKLYDWYVAGYLNFEKTNHHD